MLNETFPNQPPERRRRLPGVGVPEVVFVLGFLAVFTGLAFRLGVDVALVAAGLFAMAAAWRVS